MAPLTTAQLYMKLFYHTFETLVRQRLYPKVSGIYSAQQSGMKVLIPYLSGYRASFEGSS